jgi:hypothetical protein
MKTGEYVAAEAYILQFTTIKFVRKCHTNRYTWNSVKKPVWVGLFGGGG